MTNLNDHIKQQQEVNRGMWDNLQRNRIDRPSRKETHSLSDETTEDTIKKTLAEVTHEWNKAEQKLNGTAQGAVNCIEYFRNFLTQLEDSNN